MLSHISDTSSWASAVPPASETSPSPVTLPAALPASTPISLGHLILCGREDTEYLIHCCVRLWRTARAASLFILSCKYSSCAMSAEVKALVGPDAGSANSTVLQEFRFDDYLRRDRCITSQLVVYEKHHCTGFHGSESTLLRNCRMVCITALTRCRVCYVVVMTCRVSALIDFVECLCIVEDSTRTSWGIGYR